MLKYFWITFLLLIANSICGAQTYKIESQEEALEEIHLSQDIANSSLTISCLNDTISINEFMGIAGNVTVLKSHFLKVSYTIRSGSDENIERLLLLCVSNKKLYQAFQAESLLRYDVEQVFDKKADSLKLFDEHGMYELKLNLKGIGTKNYKLNVHIHDEVKSKHDPVTNHNIDKEVVLNFDRNRMLFYSIYETVDGQFNIYDFKTGSEHKEYISGKLPTVILADRDYYFIKGEWYEKGQKDYLIKYTY